MKTIKLSDETLEKLGATAADVDERIIAMMERNTDLEATAAKPPKAEAAAPDFSAITKRLDGIETRLAEIKPGASAEQITALETKLTTHATEAAGKAVVAAIAKAGSGSAQAGAASSEQSTMTTSTGAANETFETVVEAHVAKGMKKGAAITKAVAEKPKLYAEWLAANKANPKAHILDPITSLN